MQFALALSFLPVFTASAQFEFVTLDPGLQLKGEELQQTKKALARIRNIVKYANYGALTKPQMQEWGRRVYNPYLGSEIPLDIDLVEALFALFEDLPEHLTPEERWALYDDAFSILRMALDNCPRMAEAARALLQADLPQVIEFNPHENLMMGALGTLLKTGRQEDLEFVKGAERPEFWAKRAEGCRLKGSGRIFKDEPDAVVLTLRSRASLSMAWGQPETGAPFIESLLSREDNAVYRTYLEGLLEDAQERMSAPGSNRGPHVDPLLYPDPFIDSLGDELPPTMWDRQPGLDYTLMVELQLNLHPYLKSAGLSEEAQEQWRLLGEIDSHGYEERLQACRRLRDVPDLPFVFKRWVTLQHVLLAGSLNRAEEMNEIAREWLKRYPTDWEHLPDEYRTRHYKEINANIYLRCYLVHVYANVSNAQLAWPREERLRMTREVMEPVFDIEDPEESYVVFALLFYANALKSLSSQWAIEQRRAPTAPEERAALDHKQGLLDAAIARDLIRHFEKVEAALKAAKTNPPRMDYARGIIRDRDRYLAMILPELQMLRGELSRLPQQARNTPTEEIWKELLGSANDK